MTILRIGAQGAAVARLVADLEALGYRVGSPQPDVFDQSVKRAVLRFQTQHMGPDGMPLVMDGAVGPLTQFAIDVAMGRKAPVAPVVLAAPDLAEVPAGASASGLRALQVAQQELARGAGEQGGDNRGPDIRRYHAITGASEGDDWCASFVSYCFHTGNPGAMPYDPTAGARQTRKRFMDKGWAFDASFDNPPMAGDIIVFWRHAISDWRGHIGLVAGYRDGIVHTIEGNRTPKVGAFHYKLGQIDRLLGFGRARP
jgi:peptidoglycan hydrolase-like protein with peptidoglycan-binding domain